MRDTQRDKPWIFRTYAGHSTAADSNALYRKNLAKGQTGLSVAFDLPTQTGYDCDHVLAKGEVGKVGVPVCHLGDMRALFDGIPLDTMNTSMTINATAAWLMALYIAVADEQGAPRAALTGTIQNDIIKEYLSRGTYVFPPAPSMRLIKDVAIFTTTELPKWNPMNICSYHLQEAGATPVQELAFALATAVAVLDTVKASGEVTQEKFGEVVGRISFFVNAGLRFITEMCKMRAFAELWDEITRERYGITDAKQRLFRYGVQVNSLGPDRAAAGKQRRAHSDRNAGGDAVEERARPRRAAAGLERGARPAAAVGPAMVAAHAADPRLSRPTCSNTATSSTARPRSSARSTRSRPRPRKSSSASTRWAARWPRSRSGYMKQQLVESNTARLEAIERGEQIVVGVNKYLETEPSPLTGGIDSIMTVSEDAERDQIERLKAWRAARDKQGGRRRAGRAEARGDERRQHHAGRRSPAPKPASPPANGAGRCARRSANTARRPASAAPCATTSTGLDDIRADVDRVSRKLGRRLTFLVGKPGLDGHSNGAEQIAVRARDAGMQVVYEGIRLTPEEIVDAARKQKAHVIGLSVLSGSHLPLVEDVVARMKEAGLTMPVVVGGIIPPEDAAALEKSGVAAVYTPKDFELNRIMSDVVRIVERANGANNV